MLWNLVHRLIYYLAVVTVITTVWIAAWARAIRAEADRGWWPALPAPEHVLAVPGNAASGNAVVASEEH
jgi:hypothetical protein